MNDVMSQSHMREFQSWMQTPPFAHVVALHCRAVPAINIIIIIIDKTDAGLNGLYIRDITLLRDVINMYNNY